MTMMQRNEKTQSCFWYFIFYTFCPEIHFSAW